MLLILIYGHYIGTTISDGDNVQQYERIMGVPWVHSSKKKLICSSNS